MGGLGKPGVQQICEAASCCANIPAVQGGLKGCHKKVMRSPAGPKHGRPGHLPELSSLECLVGSADLSLTIPKPFQKSKFHLLSKAHIQRKHDNIAHLNSRHLPSHQERRIGCLLAMRSYTNHNDSCGVKGRDLLEIQVPIPPQNQLPQSFAGPTEPISCMNPS